MKKGIIIILLAIVLLIVANLSLNKRNSVGPTPTISNQPEEIKKVEVTVPPTNFLGTKGEVVNLVNGSLNIPVSLIIGNQVSFFNTALPGGKIIYFFVVKDKNGIYRAAANACQVCFGKYKGFHQEGEEIVCNNCGNRYPLEKIATEKGGCNPGPINPNVEIKGDQLVINQSDLEKVADLF